jgi:hypothetical protein
MEKDKAKSKSSILKKSRSSGVLDVVAGLVDKTERKVGPEKHYVNADGLDLAESANSWHKRFKKFSNAAKSAGAAARAAGRSGGVSVTIPLKMMNKAQQAASDAAMKKGAKKRLLKKLLKKGISQAPPLKAVVNAYEGLALLRSEKQRDKAYNQAEEIGAYDFDDISGSLAKGARGMAQGYLDPMGTIYGAGAHGAEAVKSIFGANQSAIEAARLKRRKAPMLAENKARRSKRDSALSEGLSKGEDRKLRRATTGNRGLQKLVAGLATPEEARSLYDKTF